MPLYAKDKPTVGRRLRDLALSAGVLVLIVGLVCAFVVAGVYVVHASLDRNTEAVAAVPAPPPPPKPAPAPEARPAPPPAVEVAVAPPPRARTKPADPTRVDEEGFLKYWLLLAPVPALKEMAGAAEIHAAVLPDEAGLRPRPDQRVKVRGVELAWKRYRSPDFAIDFRKAVEGARGDDVVGYAVCYVHSPEERKDVKIFLGTNDQGRAWLNGRPLIVHDKSRSLKKDADVVGGLTLRKGENTVVLKVANEKGNWQGCLRFGDKDGTPLVDLHVTTSPQ